MKFMSHIANSIRILVRYLKSSAINCIGLLLVITLTACSGSNKELGTRVTLTTEYGDIVILLDETNSPRTSSFFLERVNAGDFENASIYRSGSLGDVGEPPKFLEGGPLSRLVNDKNVTSLDGSNIAMLTDLESTNLTGLKHVRGSVSLARNVLGGGEVIPDFVFSLTDMPEFDFGGDQSPDNKGYPVFAKVTDGMEILDKIAVMERSGETHIPLLQGQILTQPVTLIKTSVQD